MINPVPVLVGAFLLAVAPALAQLAAVSGAPNPAVDEVPPGTEIAVSLANGFPIWYRDANGLKLELCLDQEVQTPAGTIFPCLTGESFPGAPISFPDNFGPEAFWWNATASTVFNSTLNGLPAGGGDALLVLAQEAAFSRGLGAVEGDQVAFGRIRIRINVPVPGTYRVTHPYGQVDYAVASVGTGREINQTQDVGIASPLDFAASLQNGPSQVQPPGFNPALIPPTGAIVASAPVNIGPFLLPAGGQGSFITSVDGRRYIADPGAGAIHLTQQVTGSPTGNNVFRIELLNPPSGFLLNGGGNVIEVTEFQLMGKVFNDGLNLAPVAVADAAATSRGVPVVIDVTVNDTDPVGAGNVHGINFQALGLPTAGGIVRTGSVATTAGGSVNRITTIPTGKASFVYTPPAGFTGVDTFTYVVQDTGGRVSAPATVTVVVEDLQVTRAEYRPKFGKWRIEGTSTDRTSNSVTLYSGPRARLSGESEVPAVVSGARGTVDLKVSANAIDFSLRVDPLPLSAVTAAHIHLGAPGQNGPALFTLYDTGPFTGVVEGTLTGSDLIVRAAQGINTFEDARRAILAGNTYVNVHTVANPGGEIRGELRLPTLGTAAVDPATGRWSFSGKSRTAPSPFSGILSESANGIQVLGKPLRVR